MGKPAGLAKEQDRALGRLSGIPGTRGLYLTERPTRRWSGPVRKVRLEAVTVFSNIELSFSEGINVIIGANGTGKTHVLKCVYALLRAEAKPPVTDRGDKLERVLAGRSRSLFAAQGERSRVSIECMNDAFEEAHFERKEALGAPPAWSLPSAVRVRALFLPSREVLAMHRGFANACNELKLSFDESHDDLCRELGRNELREAAPTFSPVLEQLERIIGGPVRLDGSTFTVDTRRGPIAVPMVAEGHRKLAALTYLIKSGALEPESVLFWDEPEANLNPTLVRDVVQVIRKLARAGVQIFLATHDYILARELSMEAEYHPADVDTRFFALHRASDEEPVEVESGKYWADLQQNPILEAYAAHDEHEQDLFAGEPPEKPAGQR